MSDYTDRADAMSYLRTALAEWKDAGAPVEDVAQAIRELVDVLVKQAIEREQ